MGVEGAPIVNRTVNGRQFSGIVANEVKINAVSGGAKWWAAYLQRRPYVVLDQTIAGAVVWLPCEDTDDACDAVEMICRHRVPRSALAILETHGPVPLRVLRTIGCMRMEPYWIPGLQ